MTPRDAWVLIFLPIGFYGFAALYGFYLVREDRRWRYYRLTGSINTEYEVQQRKEQIKQNIYIGSVIVGSLWFITVLSIFNICYPSINISPEVADMPWWFITGWISICLLISLWCSIQFYRVRKLFPDL